MVVALVAAQDEREGDLLELPVLLGPHVEREAEEVPVDAVDELLRDPVLLDVDRAEGLRLGLDAHLLGRAPVVLLGERGVRLVLDELGAPGVHLGELLLGLEAAQLVGGDELEAFSGRLGQLDLPGVGGRLLGGLRAEEGLALEVEADVVDEAAPEGALVLVPFGNLPGGLEVADAIPDDVIGQVREIVEGLGRATTGECRRGEEHGDQDGELREWVRAEHGLFLLVAGSH